MKTTLIFFLFASPVLAQNKFADAAIAPGCGAEDARFDVKTHKGQHPIAQPETGKALVYFIEDDSEYGGLFGPTTREGLDGMWVGATHGNSYFYVSVAPGEHHLCASLQPVGDSDKTQTRAVAHFTAEAGNVYYFRVKNSWRRDYGPVGAGVIDFAPLDSDEGLLLASTFSLSTFHLRK